MTLDMSQQDCLSSSDEIVNKSPSAGDIGNLLGPQTAVVLCKIEKSISSEIHSHQCVCIVILICM